MFFPIHSSIHGHPDGFLLFQLSCQHTTQGWKSWLSEPGSSHSALKLQCSSNVDMIRPLWSTIMGGKNISNYRRNVEHKPSLAPHVSSTEISTRIRILKAHLQTIFWNELFRAFTKKSWYSNLQSNLVYQTKVNTGPVQWVSVWKSLQHKLEHLSSTPGTHNRK